MPAKRETVHTKLQETRNSRAPDRGTRLAAIFNPHTAPFAPEPRDRGCRPYFGMTVTLAPVHDNTGIEDAIALLVLNCV
jgi:hypothetical protein